MHRTEDYIYSLGMYKLFWGMELDFQFITDHSRSYLKNGMVFKHLLFIFKPKLILNYYKFSYPSKVTIMHYTHDTVFLNSLRLWPITKILTYMAYNFVWKIKSVHLHITCKYFYFPILQKQIEDKCILIIFTSVLQPINKIVFFKKINT